MIQGNISSVAAGDSSASWRDNAESAGDHWCLLTSRLAGTNCSWWERGLAGGTGQIHAVGELQSSGQKVHDQL